MQHGLVSSISFLSLYNNPLGEQVVDLSVLESQGVLDGPLFGELYKQNKKIFSESSLNSFIALGTTLLLISNDHTIRLDLLV